MTMDGAARSLDGLAAQTAWLRRLARSLVWDAAAADDLVQDTYAVAAARAPRDGRPLGPWLVRVLRNLHRMRGRAARQRAVHHGALAAELAAPATPAELVDQIEVHRALAGLVLELAPAARDVVLLCYVEGLSSAAIGRRLGIPAGTVRWRHQQALAELRARLDHRKPNRAWMPALAALAGPRPAIGLGVGGLVAAALAIVVLAGWIVVQLHRDPAPPSAGVDRARTPGAAQAAQATLDAPRALDGDGRARPAAVVVRLASGLLRVEGHVVDDQGAPVEGADVAYACQWGDDSAVEHARSGAGGVFTVEIEHDCRLDVTARKDARAGRGFWSQGLALPLEARLYPVLLAPVRVLDAATGAPIVGAEVAVQDSGAPATRDAAITDPAGRARVAVVMAPPIVRGRVPIQSTIRVLANAYLPEEVAVEHDPGPVAVERTIRLARGIAIRGRVVDPDGAPVPDAAIEVNGPPLIPGTTRRWFGPRVERSDAAGGFIVAVPDAGRYRLQPRTAQLIGADLAQTVITVGPAGRDDVVIRLDRRAEVGVTGVVVGPDGAPVAGARVLGPYTGAPPLTTDAHGRFASSDIRPVYRFVARAGELSSELVGVERGAERLVHVTLTLGPAGLAGVAVDRDGFIVPGAEVYLNACCDHGMAVSGQRATADRDGRFAFDTPRGSFVLSVRRTSEDEFLDDDDVRVEAGSHDLRVIVP